MRSLNILHISDSHIQKKDEKEIREIVQKMIIDINKVQNEKNINKHKTNISNVIKT